MIIEGRIGVVGVVVAVPVFNMRLHHQLGHLASYHFGINMLLHKANVSSFLQSLNNISRVILTTRSLSISSVLGEYSG